MLAEADNLRVATGEGEDPIFNKEAKNGADPANVMTIYRENLSGEDEIAVIISAIELVS